MLINKILTSLFFSSFLITTVKSSPFLNEDETRLALDVINQLRVYHCIFYVHNDETRDIKIFKNYKIFSSKSLFTKIVRSKTDFVDLLLHKELNSLENNEMIIMKSENISFLQNLLTDLWGAWKNGMANFKWLYFLEDPDPDVIFDPDNPLGIAYNCEFIIAQRDKRLTSYVLSEIYATNDRMFRKGVGKWHSFQGLVEFNDVPVRLRRKNLERSKLEVYTPEGCLNKNIVNQRVCKVMEIVRDFSVIMNFTIVEFPFKDTHQLPYFDFLVNESDILGGGYPFTAPASPYLSIHVGPVYKTTLNWFIKYPIGKLESDYYLKPFEKYFWMAVIFSISIGTFVILITLYILKRATGVSYQGTLISNIFIGFETLCNQSGSEELENVSYRIISLSLRIIAIFSIAAYGAVITSFLAIQTPQAPFSNVSEFAEIKEYKLVTGRSQLISINLEDTRESTHALIRGVYNDHSIFINPENSTQVKFYLERLCQEKLAFASFDHDIYKLNPSCDIYKIEEPLCRTWIYITLKSSSPFQNIFNEIFVRYYETGIQKRMQKKISQAHVEEIRDVWAVELKHVTQMLSIILIGVAISSVFIVLELIYKNSKTKIMKCR